MNFQNANLLLHLFWLAPALIATSIWARGNRRRRVARIVARPDLQSTLTANLWAAGRQWRSILFYAAVLLLAVAAARPWWGSRLVQRPGHSRDLLIILDTSRSMLAKDVPPSRLLHAKWFIRKILEQSAGDRFGLIAFAGSAFLECPLTQDRNGFLLFLDDVDTAAIPVGGTNIEEALKTALEAFQAAEGSHRAVILITDGDELAGDSSTTLDELRARRIPVFVVGIGDPQMGSYIQIEGNQFVTDKAGNRIKTRLNERSLQKIASQTGGTYVHTTVVQDGVGHIIEKIRNLIPEQQEENTISRPIERYQIPLATALVLLLFRICTGERRKEATRASAPIGTVAANVGLLFVASAFFGAASPARSQNTAPPPSSGNGQRSIIQPGPLGPAGAPAPAADPFGDDGLADQKQAMIRSGIDALEKRLESVTDPMELAYLHYNLGVNYQMLNRSDKAESEYQKALDTGARSKTLSALAYQNLGVLKHEAARATLAAEPEKALQDLVHAQEYYKEAMRADPGRAEAATNQEQILIDRKIVEEMKKLQQEMSDLQEEAKKNAEDAHEAQQSANQEQDGAKQQEMQQQAMAKTQAAEQATDRLEQKAREHNQNAAADWVKQAGEALREAQKEQQKALNPEDDTDDKSGESAARAEELIRQAMQQLGVKEEKQEQKQAEAQEAEKAGDSDAEKEESAQAETQEKEGSEDPGAQPDEALNLDKLQALRILESLQGEEKDLKQELKNLQKQQQKLREVEKDW